MAIKDIIARGIGFSPGAVNFIVTHGFGAGAAIEADAGWPTRKRIILPDGRRMLLTPQEISQVRQDIEAERIRQLAEIEAKPTRKRKKARKKAENIQEIAVTGEAPIILPPMVSALPGWDEQRDLEAVMYQMLRREEDDALLLLLMVS